VRIDVVDTGPGLSETAQEHLFEPFTSSTRSGGGGLGLNIARAIVRAHGGDLLLLETGPEGTAFRVVLPAPSTSAT
jgi:signal transduction histidine kinase